MCVTELIFYHFIGTRLLPEDSSHTQPRPESPSVGQSAAWVVFLGEFIWCDTTPVGMTQQEALRLPLSLTAALLPPRGAAVAAGQRWIQSEVLVRDRGWDEWPVKEAEPRG